MDRIVVREGLGTRLADSLETALRLADGVAQVEVVGRRRAHALLGAPGLRGVRDLALRRCRRACSPSTTRYGACPDCGGIGTRYEIDPERAGAGRRSASLKQGALAPWAGQPGSVLQADAPGAVASRHKFEPGHAVGQALEEGERDIVLHGEEDDGFEGVVKMLERRYRETLSEDSRREIEHFMAERPVPRLPAARGCAASRWR